MSIQNNMTSRSDFSGVFDALETGSRNSHSYQAEPSWLIKIGTFTKSSRKHSKSEAAGKADKKAHKLKDYAAVLDHRFSLTRGFSSETSANSLMPDGGLTAHELKVVLNMNSVSAQIHEIFSQNQPIKDINLVRVTAISQKSKPNPNQKGEYQIIAEYNFEEAYVSGLVSESDIICIGFRYSSIKYITEQLDALTGKLAGKGAAMYHNFVTGSTKAKK